MKISFEGETFQHVVAEIGDFLNEITSHDEVVAANTDPTREPVKPKRTRRTKAQMTEAKTPGAESKLDTEIDSFVRRGRVSSASTDAIAKVEPMSHRRSRRGKGQRAASASMDAGTTIEAGPTTGRRRSGTITPSDNIKDADLSKAASGLAAATNPQVTLDLLTEFEVIRVQDLEGDARREFLTAAVEQTKGEA